MVMRRQAIKLRKGVPPAGVVLECGAETISWSAKARATRPAHATVIGKDMSFQPGSTEYHNVFLRYTGE